MTKVVPLGFCCDAPAMTPWAPCRGEAAQRRRRSRAGHEEIAFWLYCFATPSDEPPLAANIGGHSMGKMLGETFMRPMQLASLSGTSSHLLR